MRISFVILAYNDANTLPSLVKELDAVLSLQFDAYEIIVIDDLSNDNTKEILEDLQRQYKHLRIKINIKNLNVGGSFREAVSICKYEYIGYTDGDFQYHIQDLTHYRQYLPQYDIITGFRKNRKDPISRKLISYLFNYMMSSFFELELKDINSGLKIYNAEKLKKLDSWNNGASYDLEILLRLKYGHNAMIKEVNIKHKPRSFGIAMGASKSNTINVIERMLFFHSKYGIRSLKNKIIRKALNTYKSIKKRSFKLPIGYFIVIFRKGINPKK